MHNLFLGLFKNHCLSILGVDITLGTDNEPEPPTENEMTKVSQIIESSNSDHEQLRKVFRRSRKPVLEEFCCCVGGTPRRDPQFTNVNSQIRKADFIDAILEAVKLSCKELNKQR